MSRFCYGILFLFVAAIPLVGCYQQAAELKQAIKLYEAGEYELCIPIAGRLCQSKEYRSWGVSLMIRSGLKEKRYSVVVAAAHKLDLTERTEETLAEFAYSGLPMEHRLSFLAELNKGQSTTPKWLRRYADFLDGVGLRRKSAMIRHEILSHGEFAIDDLIRLANIVDAVRDEMYWPTHPEVTWTKSFLDFGRLRFLAQAGDKASALAGLRRLSQLFSTEAEIQAVYGRLLLDLDLISEFENWSRDKSDPVIESPDVQFVLGLGAEKTSKHQAAVGHYLKSIVADPDHLLATKHLAAILEHDLDRKIIELMKQRVRIIAEYRDLVSQMYEQGPEPSRLQKAFQLCEMLGRNDEACGWETACKAYGANESIVRENPDGPVEHRSWLDSIILPLTAASLSTSISPRAKNGNLGDTIPAGYFAFRNVANSVGIDFKFQTGCNFTGHGVQLVQSMGAGVGCVDYDLDGWTDLLMPQGGIAGNGLPSVSLSDELFRNIGGTQFEPVGSLAGYDDREYSQGVSVGDINCDGFPDVYAASLGKNKLFINCGDGRFRLADCGDRPAAYWTSSCVICDLNQDGHPDLLDITYTEESSWSGLCGQPLPRSCRPTAFRGEPDRAWLNNGQGEWLEVVIGSDDGNRPGRGLGVVVSKGFHEGNRVAAFVANDMEANELLVFDKMFGVGSQVTDLAIERNLAFDDSGLAQACMGVAVADVNRDGLQDIYVTNFYREYNTLYLQDQSGEFTDRTEQFGLAEVTLNKLGFGTQFIDADLDGYPDLFVANGHVDDFSDLGQPFRMQPQLFRNIAGQRFLEIPASEAGVYFEGDRLGRGVAICDFDRDGKEDLLVGHLDSETALLQNHSLSKASWTSIRVIGCSADRSGFGTGLNLFAGGRQSKQLINNGSGYQSANHDWVTLGLGDSVDIEKLEIIWPNGSVQHYSHLPVNTRLIVRESDQNIWTVD